MYPQTNLDFSKTFKLLKKYTHFFLNVDSHWFIILFYVFFMCLIVLLSVQYFLHLVFGLVHHNSKPIVVPAEDTLNWHLFYLFVCTYLESVIYFVYWCFCNIPFFDLSLWSNDSEFQVTLSYS